ncbi:bifunctional diguanylate cyclase/phosphodiesterase [Rhizobium sp. BK176]|uniref:putative bifunctional diguanylate cyclase/phosphodiesterase n=1 Tax=Rhizobium sp. BK176 TaxID=2587071 RepID=UPI002166E8C0|nr:EAL domain-containing protein [Rhizobium sp. BK176]MCS4090025.1 diguanylate cyclase (GGDEF)-like protein [Rhizobium sp. BK176]
MSHDPLFVVTSVIYAVVGSIMTTLLFGRALARKGTARTMWAVLAGIIGGSTIWTSHFISLLGLETTDDQFFFLFISLGALLISILLSSTGFVIAAASPTNRLVEAGGAILGIAFAANHVISIFALNVAGVRSFDSATLALAVGLSILCGGMMTNSQVRHRAHYGKSYAALAMAIGILSVHYIGTNGLTISEGVPTWQSDIGIPDRYLFAMVVFFGSMTLAIGGVVSMIDHQSRLDRVKALEFLAFHDPLTGLPNRAFLEDKLRSMNGTTTRIALVSFDLNRFKNINDVHGYQAGDHVLKTVSERLKAVLGPGELLCRIGSDEFVGLKDSLRSRDEATEFAIRIREAVVGDLEWEGYRLSVGSSLGVACIPEDGTSPEDLLIKADLAMYRSKRGGSGCPAFYDVSLDEPNRAKSLISIEMRHAIEDNQFELCYQRQNRITDGRLMGYEVLLRWNHPDRGYISPDVFIPIAEREGYINEIGEWVLRRACMEAAAWTNPMKIAVNVAARQLVGDALPGIVRSALETSGLQASRLELEITESGIISDYDHALSIVGELKATGVSIAMDDFGTGYSSLSTLQSFPFDKIKIDKAFVRDIIHNPQSAEIVRSTVLLGRNLNIDVLAEGVETKEQLEFLRSIGCGQVQGFYFGKPIPSENFASAEAPANVVSFPL